MNWYLKCQKYRNFRYGSLIKIFVSTFKITNKKLDFTQNEYDINCLYGYNGRPSKNKDCAICNIMLILFYIVNSFIGASLWQHGKKLDSLF